MTIRPTRRGTAGRTRQSVRRAAAASPIPVAWIVAGTAIGVVVVIALISMLSATQPATAGSRKAAPQAQPSRPQPRQDAPASTAPGRAGATPTTAAPDIPETVFEQADALYAAARAKFNDSVKHRRAGDPAAAREASRDAWSACEAQAKLLEPYTDWYLEADFEGWAVPAAYVRLGRLLEDYDGLRVKVQKMPK